MRRPTSGLSTLLLANSASRSFTWAGMPSVLLVSVRVTCRLIQLGPLGVIDVGLAEAADFADLNLKRRDLPACFLLHLEHAAQLAQDHRLPFGRSVLRALAG